MRRVLTEPWFRSMMVQGFAEKTFEGFGTHEAEEDEGEAAVLDPIEDLMLAIDRDLDNMVNFT